MGRFKLAILVILLFVFVTTVFAQNYYVDNLGRVHQTGFFVGGVQVTSSAAELNVLDGIPAGLTAAELGILDGVTANATELNVLDGIAVGLTAAELSILDGVTATTAELNVLAGIPAGLTAAELGYMDGVGSGVQGQLDGKQATITGAASTLVSSDLTASRALVSNVLGKVAVSAITSTELGYLNDVTGNIQGQLDALPIGTYRDKEDLVVKRNTSNPTYQIDVDYTGLMIEDFADGAGNFTADITVSGINGLEASDTEANNMWYEIYVLHGTSGEGIVLNAFGGVIDTHPPGYTLDQRYVGSVRNDGSGNFRAFVQVGDWWWWDIGTAVVATASPATTMTDLDCAHVMSPMSQIMAIEGYIEKAAVAGVGLHVRPNGSSWGATEDRLAYFEGASATIVAHGSKIIQTDSGWNIEYYATDSAYVTIDVVGYYDPI